jgi:pimeloyl-ACP methyl ester carboxylesterase
MMDLQVDLKLDYKANLERYPVYQKYLRSHRPPLLAIWGKNDSFFVPPGAEAFQRDVPNAVVKFLNTGHFALETNVEDIASAILEMPIKSSPPVTARPMPPSIDGPRDQS